MDYFLLGRWLCHKLRSQAKTPRGDLEMQVLPAVWLCLVWSFMRTLWFEGGSPASLKLSPFRVAGSDHGGNRSENV